MQKIIWLFSVSLFVLSCGQHPEITPEPSGDPGFQQLSERFIGEYLKRNPQSAVGLGFHEFDGRLADNSRAGQDAELAWLKEYERQFAAIDSASLSAKMFFDLRLLRNEVKYDIFQIQDLNGYSVNPMIYAGAIDVNTYIKRNFAPLEERLKSIIAIENQAPLFFQQAKTNLQDSLAKPFIETAIQIAKGSASFLGTDLIIALKDIRNDTLMAAFRASNKKAIDAINDFADYLAKEKLPKAHIHYAIGRENYQKMLLYRENITIAPERILEIGMSELKKEQAAFDRAAAIINPNKKPIDVYNELEDEHPAAQQLIRSAKKTMESIRQYLIDRKIVSIPSEVRVQVKETPAYARETSTASMDTPGPFETKGSEAYYYITPVDSKWTVKQQNEWLRSFNYYTTDVVTIHEAYPGHYTQFLHLNASSTTKVEKIFGSYAYTEGWAHYCEKMMLDEGYGYDGDSIKAAKFRLAQSGDALLRLCRLCVSVRTHCQGMKLDEATRFFMDNWYQGEKPSAQEALRGTFDPGYLFYTIGKLEILKLRSDYQKQEGAKFSLLGFHDKMLDNGMPPIEMLRELLLTDKTTWNNILD